MDFSGKSAVITGAGSGIGFAVAQQLARDGAAVTLLDVNPEAAESNARKIREEGLQALAVAADVTKKDDVFRAADEAEKQFGGLDHWVNCAGYSRIIPFLAHTEEIWDRTLDINLKGTFFCCQAAVTHMQERGGTIVNFSSSSGKKGTTSYAAYCASKFGIIGLTQSVAAEFAPLIRCNCICPSVVRTPMWDKQLSDYAAKRHIADEEVMPRFIRNTPMGRLCEYPDVTNLVEFLLSDLSGYMTGQSLNLTGGATMY